MVHVMPRPVSPSCRRGICSFDACASGLCEPHARPSHRALTPWPCHPMAMSCTPHSHTQGHWRHRCDAGPGQSRQCAAQGRGGGGDALPAAPQLHDAFGWWGHACGGHPTPPCPPARHTALPMATTPTPATFGRGRRCRRTDTRVCHWHSHTHHWQCRTVTAGPCRDTAGPSRYRRGHGQP